MGFWRRTSYPVFVITAVAITTCLGFGRDVLIGFQLQREIGHEIDVTPLLGPEAIVGLDPARSARLEAELEALVNSEDFDALSPEEQRARTLALIRASLGEDGRLPGAVPVDDAPSSARGAPGRIGPRSAGEGTAPGLKRIGPEAPRGEDVLAQGWFPLVAALSGGLVVAAIAGVGALLLRRTEAVSGEDPAGSSAPAPVGGETIGLTPAAPLSAPGRTAAAPPPVPTGYATITPLPAPSARTAQPGFTDEDVLRAMREEE